MYVRCKHSPICADEPCEHKRIHQEKPIAKTGETCRTLECHSCGINANGQLDGICHPVPAAVLSRNDER